MPYSVLFQRHAKAELTEAQDTYGGTFREDTNAWLAALASAAERSDHSLSVDFAELLDLEQALALDPGR